MAHSAILLAGGSGSRMRGTVKDKVLEILMGLPVILHSYKAFEESEVVDSVVFVCRDSEQADSIKNAIATYFPNTKLDVYFANGGAERSDSVLSGLKKVPQNSELAFIHDGARPLLKPENIKQLCEVAIKDGAAVLAARVSDTIKRISSDPQNLSKPDMEDLERKRLFAMQTPQVFKTADIIKAYEYIADNAIAVTDDVAAAATIGIKTSIVENIYPNIKITVPQDLAYIEFLKGKL